MAEWSQVESLTSDHRVGDFDCGSDGLTTWLRRSALVAHQAGSSRVFVVRRLKDDAVAGYYALAAGSLLQDAAPHRVLKGLGQHPVPVIILTRLGIDLDDQGKGLGRALVVSAFRNVAAVADMVGVRGLLIHAEDQQARDFYLRLARFETSPSDPLHLVLLMKDLRKSLIY